ncbi:TRAP transporter substrate-binding protein [Shewanella maritima]|uniref:TRAP transporter substrate-binding protein n=1 Tax=Shewanella maritima TaxID=2520507 RepID=UPI003735BC05
MSKRAIISWLVASLFLLGCEKPAPVTTQVTDAQAPAIEWRLVTSWPKNLPGLGMAPERFAQLVKSMSNGRLVIHVYGAGEIMPALAVFDGVSSGTVEMGHSAPYYWKDKVPAVQFFSSIPFGMNAEQMNTWLHHGGGLELWQEVYAPFDVIPMAGGNTGMQMGGWFKKPINSPEDFKGLKMRLPGIGGEMLASLGGLATDDIPGREIYSALQTQQIDAAEWVGPYNDKPLGLYQVAKYLYYPGWHEPSSNMEFIINQSAYQDLPKDLQVIVRVAARAINEDMLSDYTHGHIEALDELVNQHGVIVKPFPQSVITALRSVRDDVLLSQAEQDPMFNKVLKAYLESEIKLKRYYGYTHNALEKYAQ